MTALEESRKLAASVSAGISNQSIYTAAINLVLQQERNGKVLDFGAGTGSFSRLLVNSGHFAEVHAVDLIDYGNRAVDKIEWSFADLNSRLPYHDQSFDTIAAIEVIEHLENPRFLAREWYRLLKPTGRLIVSTPNNESWRSFISLLFRGHYSAFTGSSYPAHITAQLRSDLVRALTEAGFEDIEFTYTNHGGIPGLPSRTWQQVSLGVLKGLRYSDNLVCLAKKQE